MILRIHRNLIVSLVMLTTLLFSGLSAFTISAQSLTHDGQIVNVQNAPAAASSPLAIYTDSLASGWANWSWNTTTNFRHTNTRQSGSAALAVTYTAAWAGLYLHTNTAVNLQNYTTLRFWVHGGTNGGQQLRVVMRNTNGTDGPGVAVKATAKTWTKVEIPLSSLGGFSQTKDIFWQDTTGRTQPTFYLDAIELVNANGGSTTTPTTAPTSAPAPTSTPGTGRYFSTLPPGSTLPSDAECAAAVKSRPENKRMNATYNATRGNQRLASDFFGGSDSRANSQLAPRVTGNFTGSTDEILQWVACKWGVDEDMVRAQAAIESWWQQTTKGDWTTDASRCAPGHGLGVDGRAGQCPESWGLLQNRYPYEQSSWPGIENSSAFNADTAYAIWRACYEGYEGWLNSVEHGQTYAAGDAWGCMGRWFAGRWHTQAANDYEARVRDYLNQRIWEKPEFQES